MTLGFKDLTIGSFWMASVCGAGLMAPPMVFGMQVTGKVPKFESSKADAFGEQPLSILNQ
jgi:hypothetical protein